MDINNLKSALASGNYRISFHAFEEALKDDLKIKHIVESFQTATVIEYYLTSKPLPSCLILSFVREVSIHTVWGYDTLANKAILITVYKPDPKKWVEYKERKKQ